MTDVKHAASEGRPGLSGMVVAILFVLAATLPMLAAVATGVEPVGVPSEFVTALGLTAAALLLLQFLSSGRYENISGRIEAYSSSLALPQCALGLSCATSCEQHMGRLPLWSPPLSSITRSGSASTAAKAWCVLLGFCLLAVPSGLPCWSMA